MGASERAIRAAETLDLGLLLMMLEPEPQDRAHHVKPDRRQSDGDEPVTKAGGDRRAPRRTSRTSAAVWPSTRSRYIVSYSLPDPNVLCAVAAGRPVLRKGCETLASHLTAIQSRTIASRLVVGASPIALFWTTTQMLTVSSNIQNPISFPGRVLDVAMEIYTITVIGSLAGALGAFLVKRGEELDAAAKPA